MALPPCTPLPDDVPEERFAENLGIHYQLIGLGGDAFGARLSRTASARTPAGTLRLERGDMIVRLNGQEIRDNEDVVNHIAQTSVEFINIRNGKHQQGFVRLPGEFSGQTAGAEPLSNAPN
jgi:S1-C subfamily serine protease